jgi:hypothetical protein
MIKIKVSFSIHSPIDLRKLVVGQQQETFHANKKPFVCQNTLCAYYYCEIYNRNDKIDEKKERIFTDTYRCLQKMEVLEVFVQNSYVVWYKENQRANMAGFVV